LGEIALKRLFMFGLFAVLLVLVVSPVMAKVDSWGVGIGVPYGNVGGNWDVSLVPDKVDLSLGVGGYASTSDDGLAYNAGFKIYLASQKRNFRPRLSCYYGTNTYVDEGWGVTETSYNGVTVGIGASVAFGRARRHGLDFDLMYCASTEADVDRLEKQGYDTSKLDDIIISIGYRRFLN
jgi:hypothetical protein